MSAIGGYLILKIRLLNARLFNRYLSQAPDARYNAEQGKILSALWVKAPQSAVELSQVTGLAASTLSLMLKRLEEQGLIYSQADHRDGRKKAYNVTELGRSQQAVGQAVSQKLSDVFYKGFTPEEIKETEGYLQRILDNLSQAMEETGKSDIPEKDQ
ncbi:MarR family transcriptional regulator [Streptococcus criceti]|uniref:Transcriptional regulator, MarR family n=1 Tax=Streptococcus criceti HS-6 TaxID=873449 RepID=G5JRE7_STRCG|nr:MarR family transcriptional regulator [Streptococcus criceti]EHI74776.1 transcriptional regulator, MarR family [Streptococcus criceti HS-6]SUN43732.1 MarR family transcriptional regulator [Streptococcus criceti]